MLPTTRLSLAVLLCAGIASAQATPPSGPPSGDPAPAPVGSEPEAEPEAEPAPAPSAPAPSTAAGGAPDDVFAELEHQLTTPGSKPAAAPEPRARGAQSMNPDLALIADFAAAWFSDDQHRQTGGHDPARTGFNLQGLELNARSVVDPYLRFDANLVFAEEGVEIEEVYATTLDLPCRLQARFGQFSTRFGRINATHPHAWDFSDQPFALGRVFGAEGNRGLGVELSWLVPLPWYVELVGSATQANGEGTARSFFGDSDRGVERPWDLLGVGALKQFFDLHRDWSLLFGLSAALGPNASGEDQRTAVYGTDLYLKYRPLVGAHPTVVTWQTEVLHRRRQVSGEVLWDTSGYSQVAVRFARRWSAAARYEAGSPAYALGGSIAEDPLDPAWTRFRHRATAALTHFPSELSRFRLQGSRDMGGAGDPIWAAFLTAEVVVGAHGAHTF